jgi:hypothetical protein
MELLERVRALLPQAQEKRMFGAMAFMVEGAMALAVGDDGLLVRVGPDAQAGLLTQEGVSPMTMRGRVSRGWVRVEGPAVADDDGLRAWVERGVAAARAAR